LENYAAQISFRKEQQTKRDLRVLVGNCLGERPPLHAYASCFGKRLYKRSNSTLNPLVADFTEEGEDTTLDLRKGELLSFPVKNPFLRRGKQIGKNRRRGLSGKEDKKKKSNSSCLSCAAQQILWISPTQRTGNKGGTKKEGH